MKRIFFVALLAIMFFTDTEVLRAQQKTQLMEQIEAALGQVSTFLKEKKSAEALEASNYAVESLPQPVNENYKLYAAWCYSGLSWTLTLNKQYAPAVEAAQKALTFATSDAEWIEGNLAHAYLMSGQYNKAKELYLKYFGKTINGSSWKTLVENDFAVMKLYLVNSPLMDSIEAEFRQRTQLNIVDARSNGQRAEFSFSPTDYVKLSPDKNLLFGAKREREDGKVPRQIRVYDAVTGITTLDLGSEPYLMDGQFMPNNKEIIFVVTNQGLFLYDITSNQTQLIDLRKYSPSGKYTQRGIKVLAAAPHPDNKTVAFLFRNNKDDLGIALYDIRQDTMLAYGQVEEYEGKDFDGTKINPRDFGRMNMSFSKDGKEILIWTNNNGLTKLTVTKMKNSRGEVWDIAQEYQDIAALLRKEQIKDPKTKDIQNKTKVVIAGGDNIVIAELLFRQSDLNKQKATYLLQLKKNKGSDYLIWRIPNISFPLALDSNSALSIIENGQIVTKPFQELVTLGRELDKTEQLDEQTTVINCLDELTKEALKTIKHTAYNTLGVTSNDVMPLLARGGGRVRAYGRCVATGIPQNEFDAMGIENVIQNFITIWRPLDTLGADIVTKSEKLLKTFRSDFQQFKNKEFKEWWKDMEKGSKEYDKNQAAWEAKQSQLKKNLKPGGRTNRGLVIERKGNAVLIQPDGETARNAKWYQISEISVER
jgi:tetratricopeptide (TPR) repeat protein